MNERVMLLVALAAFAVLMVAWLKLSDTSLVEPVRPKLYHLLIESETKPGLFYDVVHQDGEPVSCSCPDYEHRHESRPDYWCKHMITAARKIGDDARKFEGRLNG